MSPIQSLQLSRFPNKFPTMNHGKTKLSFLCTTSNKKYYMARNYNLKMAVNGRGNSFDIPCRILRHPLESELPLMEEYGENHRGVGILKFFQGKNIFVTGATGLVGKVLVEKILRSTPVGKIFVLIKEKNKEAALDRLTKEITTSELFKCLQEQHGKSYASFVRDKLIPVVGDITEPNLGMDHDSANAIRKEVDVIIQSAASTTLNDRYDLLIELNANAPQRLMRFAKSCKNLKLLVHISTAYVNGRREGMILEKPLTMGENVRSKEDDHNEINGSCSFPRLDLGDESWLSRRSCTSSDQDQVIDATKYLKKLGQERADFFGWFNAYHMTKAMGEMVIHEIKGDVPVLIIRPSVIESCYQDPIPGWIQGNRMYDPVILSFGKGQLPAYLADPKVSMDIIPVDMVVNTTVAAIAKHGLMEKPGLNVYHVASAAKNPLPFCDFFDMIHEYFASTPLPNSKCESDMIKKMKCFDNFIDFSEHTRREIWERYRSTNGAVGTDDEKLVQKNCKAKVAYAEQLCKMYEFVGFIKGRFHTGNTRRLLQEMSEEELLSFEIDVTKIDWRKYFQEIHIPGLRKYVLNRQ
ncbi:fatty acyl-CoA reductase 2, chloroplastic-like [Henckelia pumila]|uniref:fatty acyl-CoA reductase 2, chloroplastic-like n=1 Tax=Henckelia pumila TaxID=405737 RepID=UPI003C6E9D0D